MCEGLTCTRLHFGEAQVLSGSGPRLPISKSDANLLETFCSGLGGGNVKSRSKARCVAELDFTVTHQAGIQRYTPPFVERYGGAAIAT